MTPVAMPRTAWKALGGVLAVFSWIRRRVVVVLTWGSGRKHYL